uniref:Uncharacterized protein n=1 Tax=Oryza meridionalis TaxID=40149 RepID=A0A0E0CIM0_9ORYZ
MKPIYPVSSSRRVPLLSAAAAYGISSYHYVRKHVRIPLFTAQIHPNKTMFNLLRREMGKMRYHESLYHVGLGLIC